MNSYDKSDIKGSKLPPTLYHHPVGPVELVTVALKTFDILLS